MAKQRTRTVTGAAWVLFWLLMVVTAVQDNARDGGTQMWQPLVWELSSALVVTLLVLAQRQSMRRYDRLLPTPQRWFAMQLLWLPIYWIAFVPLAFGIRHAVYALAGSHYAHEGWPQVFVYENIKITVFFCIFVAIRFGMLSYQAMQDEKLRAEQANALLRQAQLQQLTQQMQPHFLFNALNTISSLMHSDVERADAMLMRLADVLRATLDVGGQQQAPLETELRLLRGYAQLMGERYADRVRIDWRIGDGVLACQVPVMSMQPLLENIFKHTVEQRRQPTGILIEAQRDGAMLVLRLEDDSGRLGAETGAGIGLRNLRVRLAALHGAAATLELTQLEPAGVRAEMRLPCAS